MSGAPLLSASGGTNAHDDRQSVSLGHRPLPARRLGSSLMTRFLLLSLLSVALVSVASAYLLSRFLTERMLALDVDMTTEFINHIFGVEGADRYFDGSATQPQPKELASFLTHVGRMPDVLRANIYQLDGTVLWSTDKSLVGRRFVDNEELVEAGQGTPLFALGVTGAADKGEHVDLGQPGRRFVENYVPMYRGGQIGQQVVGVMEIYRTPRALLDALRAGERLVFAGAAIGALLIIGAQCWLVGRADRMIRRQEAAIAANERLATAGEMAAAVAHGLRNPLASIRSSAELALRLRSPERVHALLDDVVVQSDRLEHWVRQYLSAVESQNGGQTAALAPVLAVVRASFATEFERNAVAWHETAAAPDLPPVRIGPALLEQVVNGLVANAVQAMPEGGTVTVATRRAAPFTVELRIADTGVGMTPEQLRQAFVPFATTKQTGLGLGLPLARRILERHGAGIELTSEPGHGTVAVLRLPVAG
jgi:signal transduction histidine kinase